MLKPKKSKIIVILGPTSSGKSDVAIRLAKKFDGEIISADSRQIYKGLDIGTGKIERERNPGEGKSKIYFSEGVPHYLIDIVNPTQKYNASNFKKDAERIIKDILKRGKLPIICGGTGFWIKAVVDNVNFPKVKPNKLLRNKLRNKPAEVLFKMLQKFDPERAKNIDRFNKVRLIRAIEICKAIKKVPALKFGSSTSSDLEVELPNYLQIGISLSKEKLYFNIKKRLRKRFTAGMIKEIEKLHFKEKLSWKKIQSFGLGYYWIAKYLHPIKSRKAGLATPVFNRVKNKLSKDELFEKIYQAEKDYAKRQMTWFKKDKRIRWLPACRRGRKNYTEIKKEVQNFLIK